MRCHAGLRMLFKAEVQSKSIPPQKFSSGQGGFEVLADAYPPLYTQAKHMKQMYSYSGKTFDSSYFISTNDIVFNVWCVYMHVFWSAAHPTVYIQCSL